jgi:hypothetical protein
VNGLDWTGLGRPYAAQRFFLLIKTSHTMGFVREVGGAGGADAIRLF